MFVLIPWVSRHLSMENCRKPTENAGRGIYFMTIKAVLIASAAFAFLVSAVGARADCLDDIR